MWMVKLRSILHTTVKNGKWMGNKTYKQGIHMYCVMLCTVWFTNNQNIGVINKLMVYLTIALLLLGMCRGQSLQI